MTELKNGSTLSTANRQILFVYNGAYCQPNGDPTTKEQRVDPSTGHILASDVRIKRYIRDFLYTYGKRKDLYLVYDQETKDYAAQHVAKGSGSAARIKFLRQQLGTQDVLPACIDARLFGAVATLKSDDDSASPSDEADTTDAAPKTKGKNKKVKAVNADGTAVKNHQQMTGAVQFRVLNDSMHPVAVQNPQFTTMLPSSVDNEQGSIGTMSIVPYFVMLISGQLNGKTAELNGVTSQDVAEMYGALWLSLANQSSRSKQGQSAVLLVDIEYAGLSDVKNPRSLVTLDYEGDGRELRQETPQAYDITKLLALQTNDKVRKVNFYTEDEEILASFQDAGSKFSLMTLTQANELR